MNEDIVEIEGEASAAPSVFHSTLSVEAKVDSARTHLLDLSARNRLLNVPRFSKSAKTVDIVDEKSAEVFRILVTEGRAMTFLAGAKGRDSEPTEEEGAIELALPDDDERDEGGRLVRHSDTKLQTRMTPNGLQKRLLDLYFDARTLEEEQGVNILFLGLGTLKWIDPNNAENVRFAPLILVPVSLERASAGERFKLRARKEDFASNLSLEAYLERVHTIKMPEFDPSDDFSVEEYFGKIADAVSIKPTWSVQNDDIVLGFFSFAKFLMYRDLDASLWPAGAKFTDRSLVRSLLADGFTTSEELLGEDDHLDHHIAPHELTHIVDADGSQTIAIQEARKGRDLVIQGPPGTGKSQTIANIIAAAVADGKTVLFVAEKMAALEVVKRRLDQAGVGDACLELHSNKANKRAVLAELQHTWQLGAPRTDGFSSVDTRLLDARDRLNAHPTRLHKVHEPYLQSAFQVMGQLTRLRRSGRPPSEFELPEARTWSREHRDRAIALLSELSDRIKDIGLPVHHPWYGVGLASISPLDLERLSYRLKSLSAEVGDLTRRLSELAQAMVVEPARDYAEIERQAQLMERIATFPGGVPNTALADPVWADNIHAISHLVAAVRTYSDIAAEVNSIFRPEAWSAELEGIAAIFRRLPEATNQHSFDRLAELSGALPRFMSALTALRDMLGVEAPLHINAAARMVAIGQRVAEAPDASPDAFVAAIWERGLDQAGDLAEAVAELKRIRAELEGKVAPQAWDIDLTQARTAVAVHGKRMLKFASGEWRSAKALLKTVLTQEFDPDETVRLLDLLHKGKQARETVKSGDDLGRSAFGEDWRGERSDPKPLEDLVLWMRSLRGLGGEARRIASKLSDRAAVGSLSRQVGELLERLRPLAMEVWNDLGGGGDTVFPEVPTVDVLDLQRAVQAFNAITHADRAYGAFTNAAPPHVRDRLRHMDLLKQARTGRQVIAQSDELGHAAFGLSWNKEHSDHQAMYEAVSWLVQNSDIRLQTAKIEVRAVTAAAARDALEATKRLIVEFSDVLDALKADRSALLGSERVIQVPFEGWTAVLDRWIGAEEQLFKWASFRGRTVEARELGLGVLVPRIEDGRIAPDDLIPSFEMAYYEDLLRHLHSEDPQLAQFDGDLHTRLVADFASLDRQRIALSRLEVVKAHHRKVPAVSGIGPVGVLRGEMARRRGHMPIRQLMQRASTAIQALKPVFMMSPLSVAQFLPPGVLEFDLLVMDEASQIQPIDALGSIARAKQVLVVGDERQLPPTQFFSKMTSGSGDDDDDDGAKVSDIESILGLFAARGLPQRMLRWHYRSRHQSLIAVSNSQFYDNKLFIVPSPYTQDAGMGLRFHLVEGGVFEDGANKVEAKRVAEEIIKHALENPGQSLGVAAFSIKQRREIQDQLELLRRLNPATEEFFHSHPSEPFFIKNLENVQGDERDVMFISVAYAKNRQGVMNMRFGPLGAEGGERRLNVLISRAKRRCEVFASITDEDIDLERGKGKGVFAFKLFLHYARTGRLAMAQRSERDMDSVFEEQVAAALEERGYAVHPQVGIAGFFIDLAVADEAFPGRYVIGIECDGAPYHLSRSARDRDRLRQAVLEDHGWTIHRIWSTDWFQKPKAELEKAIAAIERAKTELREAGQSGSPSSRAVPVEIVTVERSDVTEIGLVPTSIAPAFANYYVQAELEPALQFELHEAPLSTIAALVDKTVTVEGPIHRDEVVTRIRTAWGLQRAGGRIDSHVEQAIRMVTSCGDIVRDGDFLSKAGQETQLRDRSEAPSPSLRRIELIPPAEISTGIKKLLEGSLGATGDEIVTAVSRGLGFKATSSQLRDIILRCLTTLTDRLDVTEAHGVFTPGDALGKEEGAT